jgi:hypothetical protein
MNESVGIIHGARTLQEMLVAQRDAELEALGGEPLVGSGHEADVDVEILIDEPVSGDRT